ncbi:MAG: DUF47 family protein [Candidatus Margulisbacteria bacterium]|nr:DUF47 family protein [Candidatus Margulisiibacteriota bacterium]
MLDKYFGFLRIQDEHTVLESFIEHNRIDEEEIHLLSEMVGFMCSGNVEKIEGHYLKIRKINSDSQRFFESISEQIIQANFDHQKQYDLIRIYQRIDSISGLIIASAKRVLIFYRIGAELPAILHPDIKALMKEISQIHTLFTNAMNKYLDNKKEVLDLINKVEELENNIDHLRSVCLETLYRLGNESSIPIGNFRIIEEIIEHLESIADAIETGATSLEWLLLD